MAIRPVSQVSFQNTANKVAFEAKKNKNDGNNINKSYVSHRLAVPLAATVLAMSPTVKSSANSNIYEAIPANVEVMAPENNLVSEGKTVKARTFVLNRKSAGGVPYRAIYNVYFISDDNDDSNFEKIQIVYRDLDNPNSKGRRYTIDKFSTYKFGIVSEDGSESNNFSLDEIEAYDANLGKNTYGNKTYFTDTPICEYIKSEINSELNNSSVKPLSVTRKIRPSIDFNLQNVAPQNKMKDAVSIERPDYNLLGHSNVVASNGKYTLRYYAMDDGEKVDFVTVQKEGGPELGVRKNIYANGVFNKGDSSPVEVQYGITELYDNNNKNYFISDKDLSMMLINVFNNDVTNKFAFKCEACEREYICHNGVVMALDGDDEYGDYDEEM